MMVHHVVEYYAYFLKYFPKNFGNPFGGFQWGADPKYILYVIITIVLSGRPFRDAAEFLFSLYILQVKFC